MHPLPLNEQFPVLKSQEAASASSHRGLQEMTASYVFLVCGIALLKGLHGIARCVKSQVAEEYEDEMPTIVHFVGHSR